jgi:hypothetical protein
VPCLYVRRFFFGCAVLEMGRFRFVSLGDHRGGPFIVGLGPRGGIVFPLVGPFSLGGQVDFIPLFTRCTFRGIQPPASVTGRGLWTTPPAGVVLHVMTTAAF